MVLVVNISPVPRHLLHWRYCVGEALEDEEPEEFEREDEDTQLPVLLLRFEFLEL